MLKILVLCFAILIKTVPCYSETTQMKKTDVHIIEFKNLPRIGNFENTEILLGGFSSLEIISFKNNSYSFRTVTDRGPNGPAIESDPILGPNLRPFLIPDFSPVVVDFEFSDKNEIKNLKTHNLFVNTKQKISGFPTTAQTPQNANRIEQAIFNNKKIPADVNGFDIEGHCTDHMSRTWISEEYLPSIAVFDENKILIKRFVPALDFPAIYGDRKINRGFEGLACDSKYVYAMLQSPLPTENKKIIRILRIDLKTLQAKDQLIYKLENENVDKIGDITFDSDGNLFVVEQNGKLGQKSKRYIFKAEINEQKSIALTENPELWTDAELEGQFLTKIRIKDLSKELSDTEKIEGISVFENKIFLITDNDFGVTEMKDHTFKIDPNQSPKLIWFEIKTKGKK